MLGCHQKDAAWHFVTLRKASAVTAIVSYFWVNTAKHKPPVSDLLWEGPLKNNAMNKKNIIRTVAQ